jgi:putative transport protein
VKCRRGDHELTPAPAFVFEHGDVVTLVGRRDSLEAFAASRRLTPRIEEVDVFSLFLGLLAGMLVGNLQFSLFGSAPVSLGAAGGTLLAGLAIGWLRTLGPLRGRIPQQSRKFLKDLGMILFLADAGVRAGAGLAGTSGREAALLLAGAFALTSLALAVGWGVARLLLAATRSPRSGSAAA